jgi:hypothetical protein
VTGANTTYSVTVGYVTVGETNVATLSATAPVAACGPVQVINNVGTVPLEISVNGLAYTAAAATTTVTPVTALSIPVGTSDTFTSAFTNGTSGATGTVGDTNVQATAASGLTAATEGCLTTGSLS